MVVLAIHSGVQLGGSTLNAGFAIKSLTQRSHRVHALNRYEDDEGSRYLRRCGAEMVYFPGFSLKMNTTTILESTDPSLKRELITTVQDVVKWVTGFFLTITHIWRYAPDVVYLTESALLQCALAARCLRVPVVCEMQAELIRGRWGLRRSFYLGLLKSVDIVYGITPFHVQPLLEGSARERDVRVIPNTIDPTSCAGQARDIHAAFTVPAHKKIVAYFGGASPSKGYTLYLEIVRRMARLRDDVVFLLAGPFQGDFRSEWAVGSARHDFEHTQYVFEFVKANALQDAVRIVGEVTDVLTIIGRADLVVSTNTFPHFSRTIIEAFHAGVPILASRDKFSLDIVEDGVNGLLADVDDVDEWVAKAQAVLNSPANGRRLGLEGRNTYRSRFDEAMVSQQIVAMFEGLAERASRSASTRGSAHRR